MNFRHKWNLVWRSLWVQSLINYHNMQGNGFAFMTRSIERTEGDDEQKNVVYYNSHPWFAVAIASVIEAQRSEAEPKQSDELRMSWMGTFGAVGDGVVWSFVKPLAILMSLALTVIVPKAFWVVPVLYLLASLVFRYWLGSQAANGDRALIAAIQRLRPQKVIGQGIVIVRDVAMIGAGLVSAAIVIQWPYRPGLLVGLIVALAAVVSALPKSTKRAWLGVFIWILVVVIGSLMGNYA